VLRLGFIAREQGFTISTSGLGPRDFFSGHLLSSHHNRNKEMLNGCSHDKARAAGQPAARRSA
jgi:hypothetical protein